MLCLRGRLITAICAFAVGAVIGFATGLRNADAICDKVYGTGSDPFGFVGRRSGETVASRASRADAPSTPTLNQEPEVIPFRWDVPQTLNALQLPNVVMSVALRVSRPSTTTEADAEVAVLGIRMITRSRTRRWTAKGTVATGDATHTTPRVLLDTIRPITATNAAVAASAALIDVFGYCNGWLADPPLPLRPLQQAGQPVLPSPAQRVHLVVNSFGTIPTDWIDHFVGLPHTLIARTVDRSTDSSSGAGSVEPLHFAPNQGNEAAAYLLWIVRHYDHLPDVTVFLHGHRRGHEHYATRVGADAIAKWRSAATPTAAAQHGIDPTDHAWLLRHLAYGKADFMPLAFGTFRRIGTDSTHDETQRRDFAAVVDVWDRLFAAELGALPNTVTYHCCAEFAVTRRAIAMRPLAFYQALYDWLTTDPKAISTSDSASLLSNYQSGRVLEYTWAMIFGGPAILQADHVTPCWLTDHKLLCEPEAKHFPNTK